MEAERRMVASGGQRGEWVLLLNGCRVSFLQDEKRSGDDGGDGSTLGI